MFCWMIALMLHAASDPMPYNPAREVTATGTVTALRVPEVPEERITFVLERPEGSLEVHAAPAAWMGQHGWVLKEGQVLTVTGSRHHAFVRDMVLARILVMGRRRLVLRDASGKPVSGG